MTNDNPNLILPVGTRVITHYERLTAELESAKDATTLPENPPQRAALNDWLITTRQTYGPFMAVRKNAIK